MLAATESNYNIIFREFAFNFDSKYIECINSNYQAFVNTLTNKFKNSIWTFEQFIAMVDLLLEYKVLKLKFKDIQETINASTTKGDKAKMIF